MNRSQFLSSLRQGLSGLPADEIEEIVNDYDAHFTDGIAAGRSEESIAEALGNPARLARELRAEAGLRRWEERRSPANLAAALIALAGLVAVDLIFLLPVLFVAGIVTLVFGVVILAIVMAGIAVVASLLSWGDFNTITDAVAQALAGIGLVAGGIGFGALLLLVLDVLVRLLGRYVRLHYQILSPSKETS
jgi:uncharacterized membrane protein